MAGTATAIFLLASVTLTLGHPAKDQGKNVGINIVGGVEAVPHAWPAICSLRVYYFEAAYHICGCSIISSEWILTAAHCAVEAKAEDFRIVAGEHDFDVVDETSEQNRYVSQMWVHPKYNSRTYKNDIALMKMDTPLKFNDYVKAAVLSNFTDPDQAAFICAGWGTQYSGGTISSKLRQVELGFFSDTDCRNAYGPTAIADSMICAGSPGKDSCQGDSGGPLFSLDGKVCGIVSWGYGCADPKYPGVYTEVSYYVDDIQTQTANN
ncbi:unnamed protein product [Allacma fusca]|uniref:Peptidase S1 domain-containing protein n=1 Tax=Allacma fusca TaxID=39272 RepID=A0A8J2LIB8_9HEXA|nr:unnamed protein product [Allacma fusca]